MVRNILKLCNSDTLVPRCQWYTIRIQHFTACTKTTDGMGKYRYI